MLLAWGLALTTFVAVSAAVRWTQDHLLLAINARYRRKILLGATRLSPRASRVMGSGQVLGRVFETEAFDTLAVNAGLSGVTAILDVGFAVALLVVIPGAGPLALALVVWLGLLAARSVPLYRRQKSWTEARIAMSERAVEGLLGRRTRVVQAPVGERHRAEDRDLESYLEVSSRVDAAETSFEVIAGRGWLVVALLTLAALAAGSSLSGGAVVAAVGAVLLAAAALTRAAGSVHLGAAVVIAWQQVRLLYRASQDVAAPAEPAVVEAGRRRSRAASPGEPVLRATDLSFRPAPDRDPILRPTSLTVRGGDRILLTGPSGGGKSTLAGLLAGLESSGGGGLLLRGLDRLTLGEREWARRVAYVPPFGRNHVFSDSFLYNLLPGRWPPTPAEVERAARVCEELGLGSLLRRMPGHLQQIVGETGWRLSHGERARLYLARALLQEPELVILDESFGALDPATMKDALDCVLRRSPALMVISHV